jgi:ribonuclease BN (tRNA processing enzyme)
MELVVLGSGTAVPHPRRGSAAFWVATEAGTLMLDFGASAHHRLAQENLDWPNLDAVWISHFHLDHCCGLAAFLFATHRAVETRERTKPLRIFGGVGLKKLMDTFDIAANGKVLDQPFPLEIIEVEPMNEFEILPGLTASAFSTPHTGESLAFRLEDNRGRTLAYTSDTGFGEDIADFARGVDLLIIESSFFQEKKTEKHLNLAEAILLIRRAASKRAMVTHFYAEWDGVEIAKEIAKLDAGYEVIEAVDGLRLEI